MGQNLSETFIISYVIYLEERSTTTLQCHNPRAHNLLESQTRKQHKANNLTTMSTPNLIAVFNYPPPPHTQENINTLSIYMI